MPSSLPNFIFLPFSLDVPVIVPFSLLGVLSCFYPFSPFCFPRPLYLPSSPPPTSAPIFNLPLFSLSLSLSVCVSLFQPTSVFLNTFCLGLSHSFFVIFVKLLVGYSLYYFSLSPSSALTPSLFSLYLCRSLFLTVSLSLAMVAPCC